MVNDATGNLICRCDLVMFETTGGAHHDRGVVLKPLPGGNRFRVRCVDGTDVDKKASDLTVIDRTFMYPGMPVALVSDNTRQPGVITGVTTVLDLVRLDGAGTAEPTVVAAGVAPAEVRLVRELTVGDYVVSGTWLGRVLEVSIDIDVLFDDGSVCRVTEARPKQLRVVGKSNRNSHEYDFYPGDCVAGDASVFKASRWLKGHWKPSRGEGTVAKVEMGGVLLHWVASLHGEASASPPPPAYQQNPRNLTFFCPGDLRLVWFWCVSYHCFFRRKPTPTPNKYRHRTMRMGVKRTVITRHRRVEFERPMVVANTHTTVDVVWQDGTRQRGLPSVALHHIRVRNQQDFLPGHRVINKMISPPVTTDDDDDDVNSPTTDGRVGIVKSMSYRDQTVCVSWNTAAPGEEPSEVVTLMSTYDVRRSPDHKFFYGGIVVRRRPTGSITAVESAAGGGTNDLSWVGHIVDPSDAQYIKVKWGHGSTSQVLFHEIALVKPQNVNEILREFGDWVQDDEDDDDMPQTAPSSMGNNDDGAGGSEDHRRRVGVTATIGKVGNIIQSVIRTASGILLAQVKMYMLSGSSMASALRTNPARRISDDGDCHAEEAAAAKALASHDVGDDVFHFKHFDVVQCPHDHHYLDSKEQAGGGGSKWLKRVQKEWEILENSLPDTIYVRAFEDRMDLLRAVMVGASGTPYQDGLFFFDLQLPPSSYPAVPPLVKYHSFGLRANPNLYPSGTVCLSLLNTFGGEGAELWSPESSSILQVVVSIQGLVLTAQPYYNEAGYTAQVGTSEGRRNEIPYCENTYLVNLHTMLHHIRRPPVGFEAFVTDHFRRRGRHVLRACEAYQKEACPVGTLDGEAFATDQQSTGRSCSLGFRLALAKIVPSLVEAFAGIGAQACVELDRIGVSRS